jgi:hypothetical protein
MCLLPLADTPSAIRGFANPGEPGWDVASFVPEPFCYAAKHKTLKNRMFCTLMPSIKT